MSKFKVTWPSGLTTTETSECTTVEGYAMERWGANGVADVEAHGVKIELLDEQVIAPEDVGSVEAVLGPVTDAEPITVTDAVDAEVVPAKPQE